MNEVVSLLGTVSEEWSKSGSIPEIDWGRMRMLEFQEALAARNELIKRLPGYACLLCENFEDHVSLFIPLL